MASRDGSQDMEVIFHRHLNVLFSLPKVKTIVCQGGAAGEAIETSKHRNIETSKHRNIQTSKSRK
jgi:hypothetical protein